MRLPETLEKIKHLPDLPKDLFVAILLVLVAFGSYNIGQYSIIEKNRLSELRIIDSTLEAKSLNGNLRVIPQQASLTQESGAKLQNPETSGLAGGQNDGMYVGSRSGKTYYFPWCSGVKRIKLENLVWFADKLDAEMKGYKPTSTCQGM